MDLDQRYIGQKIILALSGGIDSMVLADLLLKAHADFVVAHCNFHLRGEESDDDERFVRAFAYGHGEGWFDNLYCWVTSSWWRITLTTRSRHSLSTC